MNIDKAIIFQAVIDQDAGWQTLVNDSWACLNPDDRRRILVLASGGGSGPVGSLGGFDAADDGLAAIFNTDGSLAATNTFTLYEGVGHTDFGAFDVSAVTGERNYSTPDVSGRMVVWASTVPTTSADPGVDGQAAVDGDWLYVYVAGAVNEWRRCGLEAF